jgi:hypothetical protein
MRKAASTAAHIYPDADVEEELQNRLSRMKKHVRGIKRMLSERLLKRMTPQISWKKFDTKRA